MTMSLETIQPPEVDQIPKIEEVYVTACRLFRFFESRSWRSHHDEVNPDSTAATVPILDSYSSMDAEKLANGLAVMRGAEGHYDREKYKWLPDGTEVIQNSVRAAEVIRRSLSADAYAISDSLPDEQDVIISKRHKDDPKPHLQEGRAEAHLNLRGQSLSVTGSLIRRAELIGDHADIRPLESQRIYHKVSVGDVEALGQEEAADFARLAADLLSPIRDDHLRTQPEVLVGLANIVNQRREELGSITDVLLINCWRLAQHHTETESAGKIIELLDESSPVRHYLEKYAPEAPTSLSQELMQNNSSRYRDEYMGAGGDPNKLVEHKTGKPQVRLRLKAEALWSIAMRDGGFIRAGDEGADRSTNRGMEGSYAFVRSEVEKVLYGNAGVDDIQGEPIVYGYYATDETERTPAMASMDRIYGGIELVFKTDVPVDKRVVWGDSMNATALEADRRQPNGYASPELIREVITERLIPEEDAEAMAAAISFLHGQTQNTEYKPSANPYVECIMRGRLSLNDCEEIRVPARTFDRNSKLMQTIQDTFKLNVVRVE